MTQFFRERWVLGLPGWLPVGFRRRSVVVVRVDLPVGTVTLLFSDIEGSTALLQRAGDRYRELLGRHDELLRATVAAQGGVVVDTAGDSFFVVFATAAEGAAAAVEAQRRLAVEGWPEGFEVRVRMGLHSGEPRLVGENYVGLDVHRAARVMAAAHGGQVLVSQTTASLLGDGFQLRDLGEHRLKDLSLPQRLFQLRGEGLRKEFPPIRTLENRPTNLPVQRTSLVGRQRELVELGALLAAPEVRLVTVTGPGGTGKTRLALQAAAEAIEEFPNGVYFVSLAPLRDPALVLPRIAQTLGLSEDPTRAAGELVAAYLAGKRLLLLLDNFEHLEEAAAAAAAACDGAAEVTMLMTSRTPLHLSGERTFPLAPLGLPERGVGSAAAASQADAVALFVERAVAARPDFVLTETNASAVVELCARLDGLPLAIELAAARIRALPPQTILARLNQRFQLLTGGARDADERQQTLRATLDWSHDLLTAEERLLFARLSVFAGGCRIEAAQMVCDPSGDLGLDLLDGLSALTDKSLLRQREDFDGEPRFWMLESIRAYAADRLSETGTEDSMRMSHFNYFAGFARDAEPHWRDSNGAPWTRLFDAEVDNLRAAFGYAEASGNSAKALETVSNLGWLWQNGYQREGEERVRRLRAQAAASASPAVAAYADVLEVLFASGHELVDERAMQDVIERSLAAGRRDLAELTRITFARQRFMQGRIAEASALLALAEEMAAETDDGGVSAWAVGLRAAIDQAEGRTDVARSRLRAAIERPYYRQNTNHLLGCLSQLCDLELGAGDAGAAMSLAEQALELARATNDRFQLPYVLTHAGQAALLLGDLDRADELLGSAEAAERETRPTPTSSFQLEEIRLARAAVSAAKGEPTRPAAESGIALRFFEEHGMAIPATSQLLYDRFLKGLAADV
jgi:predicted ATPase/class 3 adenylate cyclase